MSSIYQNFCTEIMDENGNWQDTNIKAYTQREISITKGDASKGDFNYYVNGEKSSNEYVTFYSNRLTKQNRIWYIDGISTDILAETITIPSSKSYYVLDGVVTKYVDEGRLGDFSQADGNYTMITTKASNAEDSTEIDTYYYNYNGQKTDYIFRIVTRKGDTIQSDVLTNTNVQKVGYYLFNNVRSSYMVGENDIWTDVNGKYALNDVVTDYDVSYTEINRPNFNGLVSC